MASLSGAPISQFPAEIEKQPQEFEMLFTELLLMWVFPHFFHVVVLTRKRLKLELKKLSLFQVHSINFTVTVTNH